MTELRKRMTLGRLFGEQIEMAPDLLVIVAPDGTEHNLQNHAIEFASNVDALVSLGRQLLSRDQVGQGTD
jgi:hypothetical protein